MGWNGGHYIYNNVSDGRRPRKQLVLPLIREARGGRGYPYPGELDTNLNSAIYEMFDCGPQFPQA